MQPLENFACPPWTAWALDHLQLGVLVLDSQNRVVFANQWFLPTNGFCAMPVCLQGKF